MEPVTGPLHDLDDVLREAGIDPESLDEDRETDTMPEPSGTVPSAYAISDEAWEKRPEEQARLDRAAEAAHAAYFDGDLQAEGIERELWRDVVRAVRAADGRLTP